MEQKDVRAERLGWIDRLRVRCGRCPQCGERLVAEVDGALASSWTFTHKKWAARMTGELNRPTVHSVDVPVVRHCGACNRWYLGKWAYRKAE